MRIRNMTSKSACAEFIECDHCGKRLRRRDYVNDDGLLFAIGYEACDCEQAAAIREVEELKEARKKQAERAARERSIASHYEKAGIPPRYSRYPVDDEVKALLAECMDGNGNGLYLYGSNGTRKSGLAYRIAKAAVDEGYFVLAVSSLRILGLVSAAMDGEGTIEEVFETLRRPDLLIIDDLGKNATSAHVVSMLYRAINERYEWLKPVIITTNFSRGELVQKLSVHGDTDAAEAIVSRLCDCTRKIEMAGPDTRLAS